MYISWKLFSLSFRSGSSDLIRSDPYPHQILKVLLIPYSSLIYIYIYHDNFEEVQKKWRCSCDCHM